MGKISLFKLGNTGVILDQNSIGPDVPMDALLLAQNAGPDTRHERMGTIRKRPGLARFNTLWAGGVILGGIPMPVAQFGGAPASGGGAFVGTGDATDGSSTGTGDMTGAPGATFDGGPIATTLPGATIFNGGTTLFSGARLVVFGKTDSTAGTSGGVGWFVAPKDLSANAVASATPIQASCYLGPPGAGSPFGGASGVPGCVDNIGTTGLYYAGNIGNQVDGLTAPTIYRTNGGTNGIVATIPRSAHAEANTNGAALTGLVSFTFSGSGYTNGDVMTLVGGTFVGQATVTKTANGVFLQGPGSYSVIPTNPITLAGGTGTGTVTAAFGPNPVRNAIVDMHYGTDGFVYVCVKDKYDALDTAGSAGRVFRLNPTSGELVEWNLGPTEGDAELFTRIPYTSCYFDGRLYVGTFPDNTDEVAGLYASNGTSAVAETPFNQNFVSCSRIYNGRLFVGAGIWAAAPTFATLWSRRPGDLVSGGLTAWTQALQASGGAATSGNYFVSMVEFNGSLYASWYGVAVGQGGIYKITANVPGDPTSTSFTITAVLTGSGVPYRLWADETIMYGVGEELATSPTVIISSTDGTTWVNNTGRLPDFGPTSRARNIFFALNQ